MHDGEATVDHNPISPGLSAHRPSLLEPSFPAGGFNLPRGRPTANQRRTPSGFPRSARVRRGRGGRPLYPGAAVSTRAACINRPAPAASQRPALHPAPASCTPPTLDNSQPGVARVRPLNYLCYAGAPDLILIF